MLQKWKCIINNWINCYFNDNDNKDRNVNLDTIINIISHLRKNFNLNESKSAIFEAHTVEEFIKEKYSAFKFENGTVEAASEDEIYLVASLLLFFVCVNSKDVDIKIAMCSRLSPEDQEIILKFSKSLMECSPVTCRDVQAAITDACGLEMATVETVSGHATVAETPPALRSLHSEVRRLQAALDAERFDRNYLQEELARTNLRMTKLLKDKEQYKLDIVNLNAKISMCCGQESEVKGDESRADNSAKLMRQLQETEERLVVAQEQLDDVTYARDTYKAKVEELKKDRNKWMQLSEQESARASELSEELDTERRHVQSLKELVTELRQHNRLNGLDSSQLECDDPDASIQSLNPNISVCSEVCAHVVEVQLSEERAKIVVLKQQIQDLQDQLNELTQKSENDKQSYETCMSERENEIFNLKHRINEEIEEKNVLKSHFNDEVTKLNNELNELEQKLIDNADNSRQVIEQKMHEIKNLQEEKLSLLQSLSDETTKLETIIQQLKAEIDTEKQSKATMKESYENHIMKLNEKVLNRNNELVELQNNVIEKSEMIESLHRDLREEKAQREVLNTKYHEDMYQLNEYKREIEEVLQKRTEEMNIMQREFDEKISGIYNELQHFKSMASTLRVQCQDLETIKEQLQDRVNKSYVKLDEIEKELENTRNTFSEEKETLKQGLDEKNATICTLQTHLQDEITFKIGLQEEMQKLEVAKTALSEEITKLNESLLQAQNDLIEKDKAIEVLDKCLREEKFATEMLKIDNAKLVEEINEITKGIVEMHNNIEALNRELDSVKIKLGEETHAKEDVIQQLSSEVMEKETLQHELSTLTEEKANLDKSINTKDCQLSRLRAESDKLAQIARNSFKTVKCLEDKLDKMEHKSKQLELNFDTEATKMLLKVSETEKLIKELSSNSKKALRVKEQELKTLTDELDTLNKILQLNNNNVVLLEKEKTALHQKLSEELSYRDKFEKEYQNQCTMHDSVTTQLNNEILKKQEEVKALNDKLDSMMRVNEEKCKEIAALENSLSREIDSKRELVYQKDIEIKDLKSQINDKESLNDELELELKKAVDCRQRTIEALQKENEQLHFTLEEDNSSHEIILKEKDKVIDRLEQELKRQTIQLESIRKDYEDLTLNWEKYKMEAQENIEAKGEQIAKLYEEIKQVQQKFKEGEILAVVLNKTIENLKREKDEIEEQYKNKISNLMESLELDESKYIAVMQDKSDLERELSQEKAAKDSLETEKVQISETIKTLVSDKEKLVMNMSMLQQQLVEELSQSEIAEKEKELTREKLVNEIKVAKTLMEERECLTQQLIEEKSVRELIEKEKCLLEQKIVELDNFKDVMAQQIIEEKSARELMEKEKDLLTQKVVEIDSDKAELIARMQQMSEKQASILQQYQSDKSNLVLEISTEKSVKDAILKTNVELNAINESLKHDLFDHNAIQEVLMNDKELLCVEKEALTRSLEDEKGVRDEIESEKNGLLVKLNELNEKYSSGLKDKQVELEKVAADMKHLQTECKNQEELNKQVSTTLAAGLDKLIRDIKREGVTNEVLQKLIVVEGDIPIHDKCEVLVNIANTLTNEIVMRKNLEKVHENTVIIEMKEIIQQKEMLIFELQTEVKRLQQVVNENKIEHSKQTETYTTSLNNKVREMQSLQKENQSLANDLNDVKLQLDIKVHSLKEKLVDNENLTDKLKRTYEAQIDNLNLMITKLTSYLKDKTVELETARKEKEKLQQAIEANSKAIQGLEDELRTEKQNEEKIISDFESERQVLKNMVTVTESIMEDQKVTLNAAIADHLKAIETLQEENRNMKGTIDRETKSLEIKVREKENALDSVFKELAEVRLEHEKTSAVREMEKKLHEEEITKLTEELNNKLHVIHELEDENNNLTVTLYKYKADLETLKTHNGELNNEKIAAENNLLVKEELEQQTNQLKRELKGTTQCNSELQEKVKLLDSQIEAMDKENKMLEKEKCDLVAKLEDVQTKLDTNILKGDDEVNKQKSENMHLISVIDENKTVITNLEQLIKHELEQNLYLRDDSGNLKLDLIKTEKQLEDSNKEVESLQKEINMLQKKLEICEEDLKAKDGFISKISKDKDAVISTISKELFEERTVKEKYQSELEVKTATIRELQKNIDNFCCEREALKILRKENEELIKAVGQRETFAVQEKTASHKHSSDAEKELRGLHHQVDNTSTDTTHSSLESLKTITDLEKIIHDKNRTITTLQSDVTYLKTLMAESETKLLDVTKELEVSKENCQQLSSQLKKLVHQKNEEIADLKKHVNKMSVTENRATQIIKVSARYQAIILKRIAEIKSNTVLKELTNFGNTCDNDLRRSLNAGSITMEDLENFLETTDRHLKRCSEKQIALQKERDRLSEVKRINESEIINLKKFLTELSVSCQTFNSVKDLYSQKLSRVISVQRTVRREILNLDGRITDTCMCKLERGYAAVMQDLSECAMNLQRWVERCISRTVSPEKIKQAFMADVERTSLAPTSFQNAGLEVQLEELDKSFQKLLEEVTRAVRGEGAKDAQAVTVMEVRAEYEDKLNRMKAKMKQLYTEQIAVFKEKQREEVAMLERELQKARDNLVESSKVYDEHIRTLTNELWSVGEKFLVKKEEADWLRRKQKSGSLMSLQHMHSSGLLPPQEEPARPSDTQSLRSLPGNNNNNKNNGKREGRGLHMSDEEGEVFDNRWLKELAATPRRSAVPHGQRLSELQWRNSLCPPHLKSSYPAETQFAAAVDEDDIKCAVVGASAARQQRKEVGITAYKKPGPPTPSKQAGRLSATDSELRESLRVEADPHPSRKTSTPSRLRSLFRSSRNDTAEGTPRSRRLSSIFKKK